MYHGALPVICRSDGNCYTDGSRAAAVLEGLRRMRVAISSYV
jgi:hypothetical protein